MQDAKRKTARDFDQGLLDLYDDFCHGRIDRRQFIVGAGAFAGAGVSATANPEVAACRQAVCANTA